MDMITAFAVHPYGSSWAVGDGKYWFAVGVTPKEKAEDIAAACQRGDFGILTLLEIAKKYESD